MTAKSDVLIAERKAKDALARRKQAHDILDGVEEAMPNLREHLTGGCRARNERNVNTYMMYRHNLPRLRNKADFADREYDVAAAELEATRKRYLEEDATRTAFWEAQE